MTEGWKERENQGQGQWSQWRPYGGRKPIELKTSKPGKSDRARTKELPD